MLYIYTTYQVLLIFFQQLKASRQYDSLNTSKIIKHFANKPVIERGDYFYLLTM